MIKYTELKMINRQNLLEVLPLSKPFTVLIEPSSLCNFKCIQCFHSVDGDNYFSKEKGNMSLNRFKRIIDQLLAWEGPKIKVLKLSLYGEPMAAKNFGEMVAIAAESDVAERIEVTTNASLLDLAMAEHLIKCQLDYLRVSIYAIQQDKHQAVTGSKMNIDKIWNNLKALKDLKKSLGSEKPFVSCKMLDDFSSENQIFLDKFTQVSDETFIDKPHGWIKVDGVDFVDRYYADNSNIAQDDIASLSSERIACPMAFTTMAIRSNGAVAPCCVDFIGGTNISNVEDENLKSIWYSQAWFKFQKMQLEGFNSINSSCANCDIYKNDHYTKDTIDSFPVEKLLYPSSNNI